MLTTARTEINLVPLPLVNIRSRRRPPRPLHPPCAHRPQPQRPRPLGNLHRYKHNSSQQRNHRHGRIRSHRPRRNISSNHEHRNIPSSIRKEVALRSTRSRINNISRHSARRKLNHHNLSLKYRHKFRHRNVRHRVPLHDRVPGRFPSRESSGHPRKAPKARKALNSFPARLHENCSARVQSPHLDRNVPVTPPVAVSPALAPRVHEPLAQHAAQPQAPQLAQHQQQLSPSAALITHPGHAGFTAVDRESAHASIVVEQRADPHGRAEVSAYRQTTSTDGHTTTRLYADGRRSVETPTFRSTGHIGGPQFVRYQNGLRAAYMPSGHPLYAERFTTVGPPGAGRGRTATIVERTIYATDSNGRFTQLSQPERRYYTVTPIGGYDTYVYRPREFAPAFFPVFYTPFAVAIVMGPQCLVCPAPVVAFAAAPARYSDPIELLGRHAGGRMPWPTRALHRSTHRPIQQPPRPTILTQALRPPARPRRRHPPLLRK